MSEIYTRKFGENRLTDLPPGYHGNAFRDGTKLHEPTEEIGGQVSTATTTAQTAMDTHAAELPENRNEPCADPVSIPETPTTLAEHPQMSVKSKNDPLAQLIGMLKGKIGTEELILILVILLIASDGIGPETLILSLALLAG